MYKPCPKCRSEEFTAQVSAIALIPIGLEGFKTKHFKPVLIHEYDNDHIIVNCTDCGEEIVPAN